MKTLEESAREFLGLNSSDPNYIHTSEDERELLIFQKGAEFAQRWIPVEEELPKELRSVLLKSNYKGCDLYDIGFLLNNKFQTKYPQPTHWRPIELK